MGILIPDSIRGLTRDFMEDTVGEEDIVDVEGGEGGMKLDSFMERLRLRKAQWCQGRRLRLKRC